MSGEDPGHVFAVYSDLRTIACDAICIPTGSAIHTRTGWFTGT